MHAQPWATDKQMTCTRWRQSARMPVLQLRAWGQSPHWMHHLCVGSAVRGRRLHGQAEVQGCAPVLQVCVMTRLCMHAGNQAAGWGHTAASRCSQRHRDMLQAMAMHVVCAECKPHRPARQLCRHWLHASSLTACAFLCVICVHCAFAD